jgi:sugar phosphate isomerase/epimerase
MNLMVLMILSSSCSMKKEKKSLSFQNYPNLKVGFSTQDFSKSMHLDVKNIQEVIKYAAQEGYSFIELRDPEANLTLDDCKELASFAKSNHIEVLYEINSNLLAPDFFSIFQKAIENTAVFPGEGIIRTLVSNTEFAADKNKKGWTEEELDKIVEIADSCGNLASQHHLKFIVENANEAFFGKEDYYGFADFFNKAKNVGLQFDTANPFQDTSREKADPDKVGDYLLTIADRWVTTHLKSGKDGISQPVLNDNPLDLGKVLAAMSANNVHYVAFELAGVTDKKNCFENHSKSIDYLLKKGLMSK